MNFLIVSNFIFEKIKYTTRLMINQRLCFLRKKNLSPILVVASLSEAIEIKIIPITIKLEIKKINGDLDLVGFIGRFDD